MADRPWHKRYHGDALTGFMVLTLEERGAFQTLLDMMYDSGGPIPDNEAILARYMGVSTRKWRSLRSQLIRLGKISVQGGCLLNGRALEVIFEAEKEQIRRSKEWPSLRIAIFERDGFRCTYCGDAESDLECDHIYPVHLGGDNDPENLTTACRSCNRSKGGKTVAEWLN